MNFKVSMILVWMAGYIDYLVKRSMRSRYILTTSKETRSSLWLHPRTQLTYSNTAGSLSNNAEKEQWQPVDCNAQIKQHRLYDDWDDCQTAWLKLVFLLAHSQTSVYSCELQAWAQIRCTIISLITSMPMMEAETLWNVGLKLHIT